MPSKAVFRSSNSKICSWVAIKAKVKRLKLEGKCVVFANGCFDILHAGHVALFEKAKSKGDALIIAINSDKSVKKIKGPSRPIVSQQNRAKLLASLECVDYVVIFNEPTPLRLIKLLKPDMLVKGADWSANNIVGRDIVERSGGKVVRIPLKKGYSTTALINKILKSRNPLQKAC